MNLLHWLVLGCACALPLSASAQWQWVDNSGKKVFSDQPPPTDIPEKNILRRAGPSPSARAPAPVTPAPEGSSDTAAAPKAAPPPKPTGVDKELEERPRRPRPNRRPRKRLKQPRSPRPRPTTALVHARTRTRSTAVSASPRSMPRASANSWTTPHAPTRKSALKQSSTATASSRRRLLSSRPCRPCACSRTGPCRVPPGAGNVHGAPPSDRP